MGLDARTLMLLVAVLFCLSAVGHFLLWRMHRNTAGLMEWSVGQALVTTGVAFLFIRSGRPDVVSNLAGNTLVTAGIGMLAIGNQKYLGYQASYRAVAVTVALTFIAFVALMPLYDDPEGLRGRIVAAAAAMGVLSAIAAWPLARARGDHSVGQKILAAMFTGNVGACILRAGGEVVWLVADGRAIWVQNSTTWYYFWLALFAFSVAGGVPIMITERLRNQLRHKVQDLDAARRTAESALREHRNFLSMISHEFRTPLGVINAAGEVIACNLPEQDEESHGEIARIRRTTRRLSLLVEGCLTDEWLTSATGSLRSQTTDLKTILGDLAAEYGLGLSWQVGRSSLIEADPYLLPIAVSCVLDNACKYGHTRDGVKVEVRSRMAAAAGPAVPHFIIDVHDDGPGIPAAERAHVFEKYYRASQGLHQSGTGLGLFLARRILDLHGGSVEILDPAFGGATPATGCIVRVTVPGRQRSAGMSPADPVGLPAPLVTSQDP